MIQQEETKDLLQKVTLCPPQWLYNLFWVFIAFGIAVFFVGLFDLHAQEVWQALLVNNLFFTSLALGGLALSFTFTITSAVWARPVKRIAEGLFSFAPISFLLFIVLFYGSHYFFTWVYPSHVIAEKAGWLNFSFFVKRNVIMYIILFITADFYLYYTIRPDVGLIPPQKRSWIAKIIAFQYGEHEKERETSYKRARFFAPFCAIAFALLTTLIAFDWIMSIDQSWFSTMFGVQYAVSSLVVAFAVLMLLSGIFKNTLPLSEYITTKRYHDISKLSFASCLLWTYVVFSQILTIWYGNLPEESPYLALRMLSHEWGYLFWVIGAMLFLLPTLTLLSRTTCNSIWFSRIIAIIIIIGSWLEKYFLVIPSIQENQGTLGKGHSVIGVTFNFYDFAITLGMLGVFSLCFLYFMTHVPIMAIGDKLFTKE